MESATREPITAELELPRRRTTASHLGYRPRSHACCPPAKVDLGDQRALCATTRPAPSPSSSTARPTGVKTRSPWHSSGSAPVTVPRSFYDHHRPVDTEDRAPHRSSRADAGQAGCAPREHRPRRARRPGRCAKRETTDGSRRASPRCVRPEPFPAGHWMDAHPKVRLSPHISWSNPDLGGRIVELVVDNVRRYLAGSRPRASSTRSSATEWTT